MTNDGRQLLSVQDLNVSFDTVCAVRSLSLTVDRGRIAGIVGESGSGKSTLLRCIAGLLHGRVHLCGDVVYQGTSLLASTRKKDIERARRSISYVFQDPTTSLDPLYTIRAQFDECIMAAGRRSHRELSALEENMLEDMGIKDPERVLASYPHQISGGMCQRVVLAMCLASQPDLLLADEPTSALDVVSQAQVLERIRHIRDEYGTTVLLVSHNIAAVAEVADTIGVMFRGALVEEGAVQEIVQNPVHPYTRDLISSIPRLDGALPSVPRGWNSEELSAPGVGAAADETTGAGRLICPGASLQPMISLSETHRVLPFDALETGGYVCC